MAERRRTTRVAGADEAGRRSRAAEDELSVKDVAGAALEQLTELTAKPAESIIAVKRTDDGWSVGIEVVEDRRIPSSADIMATYQADLDEDGDLLSYHRVRRYLRGSGNDSGES